MEDILIKNNYRPCDSCSVCKYSYRKVVGYKYTEDTKNDEVWHSCREYEGVFCKISGDKEVLYNHICDKFKMYNK